MSFPPSFLEELRDRVQLSDVVGRRVSFDRRKSNPRKRDFWACCPFHGEKTPSFHVDDGKGYYYCFGCGAKGDAITFVQQIDNVSFVEAIERLAGEAGIALPARDPRAQAEAVHRRTLVDALEAGQRLFVQALKDSAIGAPARRYLEGRACGPHLWDAFGLGFAPAARTRLADTLTREGFTAETLIEAGIVARDDAGALYDRFRERVIFPIRDARERLVGFGGRSLIRDPQVPKYLNSPETALFDKGRLLFNLGPARRAAREAQTLLVVEGYMDVIALHGAGVRHAVAPLGTALTEDQLRLLWQTAAEPILCFDGDEAGQRAAQRALELALPHLAPGRSLRFVVLPNGQDPDDLARQGGDTLQRLLAEPRPLIDVLWERERDAEPLDTPERRAGLEQRVEAAVRRIGDNVVRSHYRQALQQRLRATFAPPRPAAGSVGAGRPSSARRIEAGSALRRSPLAQTARRLAESAEDRARLTQFQRDTEVTLTLLLIDHPALLEPLGEALSSIVLKTPTLDRICSELIHLAATGGSLDRVALRNHLTSCGVWDLVERLAADDWVRRMRSKWVGWDPGEAERYWQKAFERQQRARTYRAELEATKADLDACGDDREREAAVLARLRAMEVRLVGLTDEAREDEQDVRLG